MGREFLAGLNVKYQIERKKESLRRCLICSGWRKCRTKSINSICILFHDAQFNGMRVWVAFGRDGNGNIRISHPVVDVQRNCWQWILIRIQEMIVYVCWWLTE